MNANDARRSSIKVPASQSVQSKCFRRRVAICLRDADAKYNTFARMHRWNIPTRLDLNRLASNTLVTLDFTAHPFLATGKVDKDNPLQPESPTRAKLSYIHVQLFNYSNSSPAASGFKQTAPDRLMFAHINTHDIHFLICRTAGMNITQPDPSEAVIWVASALRTMIMAMSNPVYISKVKQDIKARQQATK
ncbi:hypothetical protein MJO28_000589 [Puccinia striiformis f. sp. tritici]|uniref:Uncharacterized protein n=1 Tax=Puccinia striiformis f. sp. tritici TaxID=168172 RepID=A0ACC0EYD0_9BASI|nr:hypothetical protein Pst134EA_000657 [Puccinia striiformis f. sp. tritici]KAH9473578.1 hypothetical protein Pst134EA_000657 [Puccinia striiformis f. sp. tritici]KAI7962495.1 hypothetical protein MJO28_000589 [Puccinia striiformis f. sp. tritici]KAI9601133.1 hypothetical protein H4Q26_000936 [Puccinia striiformis f. sp. tritici PST-130]